MRRTALFIVSHD